MEYTNETDFENLPDRPLFGNGEERPGVRIVSTAIIFITSILVLVTSLSAFIPGPHPLDIFFVFCIILICVSHLTLIVWYRQGDLDPKFKKMIYFNAVCIIMLCVCGNIFFHT